MNEREVGKN